ncbi:hypothetical protein Tco_1326686 [Tanacetum coccineum]
MGNCLPPVRLPVATQAGRLLPLGDAVAFEIGILPPKVCLTKEQDGKPTELILRKKLLPLLRSKDAFSGIWTQMPNTMMENWRSQGSGLFRK